MNISPVHYCGILGYVYVGGFIVYFKSMNPFLGYSTETVQATRTKTATTTKQNIFGYMGHLGVCVWILEREREKESGKENQPINLKNK